MTTGGEKQTMRKSYAPNVKETVPFRNLATVCVGTGRMGLALTEEYQRQLALTQELVGFDYIRGHGLFCDDMAIYQEYSDENGQSHAEYNFTYLDRVMDAYRRVNIRPFLELGFMPKKLASGEQTIFYWRGNVTPPKTYEGWKALVKATLTHLIARYGAEEVRKWPIEVWNEPNLPGFWKDADMEGYFHLFKVTLEAIREVDEGLTVGGPAICGVDDARWMREFLAFCQREGLRPDFITRHHYASETPDRDGHYVYVKLCPRENYLDSVRQTREIVDGNEMFKGYPVHITEFNTSYCPNAPIHDTVYNAAYIASLLAQMGDMHESYSYWTFGDVFEENGVPYTPFHGGFGLVANGGIPKPTLWAFRFFKDLKGGRCVHRAEDSVVVKTGAGEYRGAAWNTNDEALTLAFRLPARRERARVLITHTVDEAHGNPLKLWHELGEPASLSEEELALLKNAARPYSETRPVAAEGEMAEFEIVLQPHAIMGFVLRDFVPHSDRGYSYERTMAQR